MNRRAGEEPVMGVPGGIETTIYPPQEPPATDSDTVTTPGPDETADKPPNYRTRRCMRWAQGNCHLGDSCTFLHSGEEGTHFPCRNFLNGYCPRGRLCDFKHDYSLLPPFGGSMVPFTGIVQMPSIAKKSSALCRHFEKGYCSLGAACGFQHPPPGQTAGPVTSNLPANAKTTQCRHFVKGFCNLGENCGFAHGEKEGSAKPAVPVVQPPSNICRHYERGFCRLGQTCGFQHPGFSSPAPQVTQASFANGFTVAPRAFPATSEAAGPFASTTPFYTSFPFAPTLPVLPSVPPQLASPPPPRRQTEVCRHWAKGYCQLDRHCGFLHPNP